MPTTPPEPDAIPPVWFSVPDGFHSLPIAATPEERAALADGFVRELFPNGDDALWASTAPYYAGMGELMGSCGHEYSALGLFARDEGGVAHCAFNVGAVESRHPSAEAAATGVREVLVRDSTNDVRWLDLPCGPAVSSVTLREFTVPAELAADGEETKLRAGQIQIHVPFPTGPYIGVFTLDTASMDYWGEFCEMTAVVMQTVSFSPPQE
ncbi:hypothetical protein DMB38_19090 [Streptomyces sp. WAC 06738]|uniref:hypothetical protein n=1 Tax=Streptomyces sp. WAC 06738 TaxID=2203210 RepID=UPI000F7008CA|nr:hypothetical protein [Streptomyces sp. WAC 06738]AZM47614.1 hypothetical protein DMB38_19090 [Streptomyces sp. WAC 06738]